MIYEIRKSFCQALRNGNDHAQRSQENHKLPNSKPLPPHHCRHRGGAGKSAARARGASCGCCFRLALLCTGLFRSINLINLLACFLIAMLFCNLWLARRQVRNAAGTAHLRRCLLRQDAHDHSSWRFTIHVSSR